MLTVDANVRIAVANGQRSAGSNSPVSAAGTALAANDSRQFAQRGHSPWRGPIRPGARVAPIVLELAGQGQSEEESQRDHKRRRIRLDS